MFSFNEIKKYIILLILGGLALIGIFLVSLHKSNGGTWECRNGQWVAVGDAGSDPPKRPCY